MTLSAAAYSKMLPGFMPVTRCWICGGDWLAKIHQGRYDFALYASQDPEIAAYTGQRFWLQRCRRCGFAQPESLPILPNYFDRMYDQHWTEEWIEQEFEAGWKDDIFHEVLTELDRRVSPLQRTLLDIGTHVGRLIYLAGQERWQAEGIELNPRTSAYAARRTGLPVHRINSQQLAAAERRFSAVTMIDVLEHIPYPLQALETARSLLVPGGWIAVKVPCGRNQLLKERLRARLKKDHRVSVADNLVHVNHFSPTSLRRALEVTGFSRIVLTVGAPELIPKAARPTFAQVCSNWFRSSVCRVGRLIPMGVYTPLAFNLQAYAQNAE